MNGTVRYFDADERGYTVASEAAGEILADNAKFVTVHEESRTLLIPIQNTIHIEAERHRP